MCLYHLFFFFFFGVSKLYIISLLYFKVAAIAGEQSRFDLRKCVRMHSSIHPAEEKIGSCLTSVRVKGKYQSSNAVIHSSCIMECPTEKKPIQFMQYQYAKRLN